MESTPLSHDTYYLALGISAVCILIYYAVLRWMFRPLNADPDTVLEAPPQDLSPGAIRYLWTGDVDWDILPTIAFSAVQQGVYQLSWSKGQKSAGFTLINPQSFRKLSHDEQACLSMGRNVPLKGVVFSKKKKGLDEKMAHRVEDYLKEKYAEFINPVQRWMMIGLISNIILILLSAFLFLSLPMQTLFLSAFFMGLMLVGSGIYFDRFLDESANSKKWLYLLYGVAFLGFFMAVDSSFGVVLVSAFGLMIPVHLWMYLRLLRHSKKGLALKQKIEAYRTYLHHHKTHLEPQDIPYCLALNIPCEEAEQLTHLLTQAWTPAMNTMSMQQIIHFGRMTR